MIKILQKLKPLHKIPSFNYMPRTIQLRNERTGYYMDPNEVARRLVKLVSLHDKLQNPSKVTLNQTWFQLGIDDLTYVEIMLEVEREFSLEFPDEAVERFRDLKDVVEFVSRSFYAC